MTTDGPRGELPAWLLLHAPCIATGDSVLRLGPMWQNDDAVVYTAECGYCAERRTLPVVTQARTATDEDIFEWSVELGAAMMVRWTMDPELAAVVIDRIRRAWHGSLAATRQLHQSAQDGPAH